MPREVMRYMGAAGVKYYRLVDQRPAGTGDSPNGVIERLRGVDAMGAESWERVTVAEEPHLVWDLLNALADMQVTGRTGPFTTFAVHEVPHYAHVGPESLVQHVTYSCGETATGQGGSLPVLCSTHGMHRAVACGSVREDTPEHLEVG